MPLMVAKDFFQSSRDFNAAEKAAAFDFITRFEESPRHPSFSLERVTNARSDDVWSARVNQDLRAILHKRDDDWALLHVGHHDAAYRWAERREVGHHPVTGVLQIVETVESVRQVEHLVHRERAPGLFDAHGDEYLLSLGVPGTWLALVREIQTEDQLFSLLGRLPEDVQERLVDLAAGGLPTPPVPVEPARIVEESPDLRRRFFVVEREDELHAVLNAPMESWIAFLHPSQRAIVDAEPTGPVKVSGSAGTGKTVVGLHRARRLAQRGRRVLFTTFVNTLARNLERSLDLLCTPEQRALVTVSTVHKQAFEIAREAGHALEPINDAELRELVREVLHRELLPADPDFVHAEWEHVVHAQGLRTWEEYRDARRTGRVTPLPVRDREALWPVFAAIRRELAGRGRADWPTFCRLAEEAIRSGAVRRDYEAVVVDEVQDLKGPDLRLLAALTDGHDDGLMVLGDAGQRIYPGGFSLAALGIDVRGRSHVLRINYRTTEQIRRSADRILGDEVDDLDAGREARTGTRSLLEGPEPVLVPYRTHEDETAGAVARLKAWLDEGLRPEAIGVFARRSARLDEVRQAAEAAGLPCRRVASERDGREGIGFGTMHGAKGLEFKAVLLVSCARGIVPLREAIKHERDPVDRAAASERERRLLYVAMTRARDELTISWARHPSPFLETLLQPRD